MTRKNHNPEKLPGLGPKSMACLKQIGIHNREDLEAIGAMRAFLKLQRECTLMKPSLNFLYAMVGALENKHWKEIAKSEKSRLLAELEGYRELEKIMHAADDGRPRK